jgi:branched-chain amino acid transport system substrate-binding protein
MKKAIGVLIILFLIVGVLTGLFFFSQDSIEKQDAVYIAVVGPMSGSGKISGQAMLKGVQLYVDQKNESGGLDGRKIVLQVFDDQNNKQKAVKIATDIAFENKALVVLGHYYSSTSQAAGEVYKRNGIPAITASATAEDVTRTNEWYFRVVPNNRAMAAFIAIYTRLLQKDSASIIFDQDSYGTSLAENFEKTSKDEGISLNHIWSFDSESPDLNEQLEQIIAHLRSVRDPGAIFFATHDDEGVRIVTSVKFPGTNYTFIGADAFSTQGFLDKFSQYPLERAQPGYYSDGIYTVSPFILDIANEEALTFRDTFTDIYQEEPSWEAACYYDAAQVAVEAIERSEIRGGNQLRDDRRRIKESLKKFNTYARAVRGASGDIYFDEHGDVVKPLAVGIWQKLRLIPAFTQYSQSAPGDQADSSFKQSIGDTVFIFEEKVMTKTNVVYAGVDINEISNLDIKTSRYLIDFYLWFRFQGDFDDTAVTFTNAVTPIVLEEPIAEEEVNGVVTRTYHVKGEFQGAFEFHDYPFDRQKLLLQFHHEKSMRTKLIYVPDILGMTQTLKASDSEYDSLNLVTGWAMEHAHAYQNILIEHLALAGTDYQLPYSQFNLALTIRKTGVTAIAKNFFPIIMMVVMLYFVHYLPVERPGIRTLVFLTILAITGGYHWRLLTSLPRETLIAIEYAFFTVYALTGFTAVESFLLYWLYKHKAEKALRILNASEKLLYVVFVALASVWLIYKYQVY